MRWDFNKPEPTLRQIEDAKSREQTMFERGIERYHTSVAASPFEDTPAGIYVMREIVDATTARFTKMREDALEGRTTTRGPKPLWTYWLPLLQPDMWAFLTVRALLSIQPAQRTPTAVALQVTKMALMQIEFDAWKYEQQQRLSSHPGEFNHWDFLRKTVPQVDDQTWSRWRKKLGVDRVKLPDVDRIKLGTKLLYVLVEESGGWFEIRKFYHRGHVKVLIDLTEEAQRAIIDVHDRLEIARPLYGPIPECLPKPWRYE